jgi:D-xylono/L-arabinono-1,4-lactonase
LTVEQVATTGDVVGESPLWDPEAGLLVWTDIESGRLSAYDPRSGTVEHIHWGLNVGAIVKNRRGGYVLFSWDGVFLWRRGETPCRFTPSTLDGHPMRFNEAIGEPNGGAFAGTYVDEQTPGVLVRIDSRGSATIVAEGIGCANGMGFSPDLGTFYQTDSTRRTISAFDYDARTGRITNRRTLLVLDSADGVPDGLAVDRNGFIWSALWYAGSIIRIDPDGVEERRIRVPALQCASVAFGGRELEDLYITSASFLQPGTSALDPIGYDWETYANAYRGGALFRMRPGILGREKYSADFSECEAARGTHLCNNLEE